MKTKIIILLSLLFAFVLSANAQYVVFGTVKTNDSINTKFLKVRQGASVGKYLKCIDILGNIGWGTSASPVDSIYFAYCNGCTGALGWKSNHDTMWLDTNKLATRTWVRDSIAKKIAHYTVTGGDTNYVKTTGTEIKYGKLTVTDTTITKNIKLTANPTGTDTIFITRDLSGTTHYRTKYYFDNLIDANTSSWKTTGNTQASDSSKFIGTTNAIGFDIKMNNVSRLHFGANYMIGFGTTQPIHGFDAYHPVADSMIISFTNLTTTHSRKRGLKYGITGNGTAFINQRENQPLIFYTKNLPALSIDASQQLNQYVHPVQSTDTLISHFNHVDGYILKSTLLAGDTTQWDYDGSFQLADSSRFIGTTNVRGFGLKTNNTERLHITGIGNVGIGTSSPLSKLAVISNRTINNNTFNFVNSDLNKIRNTIAQATDTSSFNYKYTTSTGKPMMRIKGNTGNTIFDLDSAGLVGIGGVPNTYNLNVYGNLNATTSISSGGAITASSNNDITGGGFKLSYIGGASYIKYSATSAASGYNLDITGMPCLAATANLGGGTVTLRGGNASGSGESQVQFWTSGGMLTGASTSTAATQKMAINGVGGIIFTPKNTNLTAADSLTAAGGITMAPSANVHNMGAYIINYNGRFNCDITANPQIDTTNAVEGQIIIINNVSPTAKTLKFDNGDGLITIGAGSFVLGQGDAIQFQCIKINNRRYWRQNWSTDVTP